MATPAKLEPETNDARPRRVRGVSKNSAEARRKLIESAIHIFGKHGFARAKTEDVAEHAGYGQAAIFFHFKTKAGLLQACLDNALEQAKANLVPTSSSDTLDLVQRLDRAFDNSSIADFFARTLWEFDDDKAVRAVYADFHEHVRQLITAKLAAETGVDNRRAYLAAAALLSMMVGVRAEQRLETRRLTPNEFRQMLLDMTRLTLSNLAAPATHG
ncbi:MAG: TetR/AcrR family transcriptional regulator [Limnohabitans sp.]